MKKLFNANILAKFSLIAAISLTACSSPQLSGYALKKDLTNKAKPDFNPSIVRENGKGFALNVKSMKNPPKRIALVSFYVDDPGLTKTTKSPSTSTWNTTNTGEENAKIFANQFYENSIESLKASFAKFGMQILTPQEFLTTETKKSSYNNFVMRHTTMNLIGDKLNRFMKNSNSAHTTIETDEAASSFVLLKINKRETSDPKKKAVPEQNLSSCMDGQMIESLGFDLCKSLDVDAVLIVYNNQLCDEKWSKSRFWMSAVNMQMFGPNPTPLKEGKRDGNNYNKGVSYCGVRMHFSKGLLINPKIKDPIAQKANNEANLVAYNNMIIGCSNKIGNYLKSGK